MYANPKETTSLRLDEAMKRRGRELLALHGMTLTEAFEECMDKLVYRGEPRGIGVDPTCAMRSFAFQIALEGDIPFDPVDAGFEADGGTAVTSVKIPEDVAGEMKSVLKGLGTDFSQAVKLLALQTTALGGMPFAAGIPRKAR